MHDHSKVFNSQYLHSFKKSCFILSYFNMSLYILLLKRVSFFYCKLSVFYSVLVWQRTIQKVGTFVNGFFQFCVQFPSWNILYIYFFWIIVIFIFPWPWHLMLTSGMTTIRNIIRFIKKDTWITVGAFFSLECFLCIGTKPSVRSLNLSFWRVLKSI